MNVGYRRFADGPDEDPDEYWVLLGIVAKIMVGLVGIRLTRKNKRRAMQLLEIKILPAIREEFASEFKRKGGDR